MTKYAGSCLCKKVAFELRGEFDGFFFCHCSRCRKVTGSAHGSNLFAKSAELKWISGQENVRKFQLPGTRFVKSFCENCGSALPSVAESGRIVIPAGSLDDDVDFRPDAHIFAGSKANWDQDLELLIKYEGLPTA